MGKTLVFQWMGLLIVLGAAYAQSQPMPDLIVDPKLLKENWIVHTEDFTASQCDAIEGGISAGEHPIMRFTVSTPNIGNAPEVVGDPQAHIDANDGLFEFAPCHNHFHFRHYALYELIDPISGFIWRAAKRGFCMEDNTKYQPYPGPNNSKPQFTACGSPGIPGNQGISPEWADVYIWALQGQYFVLDGGDGQPPVPPGNYIIRITVNPGFVPAPGEPCRFADPLHPGVCHQLPESDFENNVTQITVMVPDHPGKQAVGPLASQSGL
jgi:Lysyl oxidase